MKREELTAMGLTDEQIEKIIAENSKDVQAANAKANKNSEELTRLRELEKEYTAMSRFYRPLQSPLCIFPQNLCRITTTKLLAHLSANYRLLQSPYRLIDADKVFHRYMVARLQAVTWKTLMSLVTALNSIPL